MAKENRKILIVDDTPSIHDDFTKILTPPRESKASLSDMMASMRGEDGKDKASSAHVPITYLLFHAHQGKEAHKMVKQAVEKGEPYALAYVDVRMPPGWDGIETIKKMWEADENLEVVICTAYSDYSWDEILAKLGTSDKLQFLRKPVDFVSIKQMALALTTKWNLARLSRQYVEDLESEVNARTKELSQKVDELQRAMDEIHKLRGIIPMCAYCHKVRDDANYWRQVDDYIRTNTEAEISHGVCPECYQKIMGKPLSPES